MPAHAPSDPGHRVATALRLLCCGLMTGLAPISARAQEIAFKPPVQLETRVDLLGGPPAGAQLGVGANVAAGYYLRVGADVAAGAALRDGGGVASGRVDIVTRYLLDPFHELRWGPYAGGGFTALWDRRASWRGDLLLLVGIEGPAHAGWRTSVELGLGGGARLGVVLRRARLNGR
jgi:hypothetical protein